VDKANRATRPARPTGEKTVKGVGSALGDYATLAVVDGDRFAVIGGRRTIVIFRNENDIADLKRGVET